MKNISDDYDAHTSSREIIDDKNDKSNSILILKHLLLSTTGGLCLLFLIDIIKWSTFGLLVPYQVSVFYTL